MQIRSFGRKVNARLSTRRTQTIASVQNQSPCTAQWLTKTCTGSIPSIAWRRSEQSSFLWIESCECISQWTPVVMQWNVLVKLKQSQWLRFLKRRRRSFRWRIKQLVAARRKNRSASNVPWLTVLMIPKARNNNNLNKPSESRRKIVCCLKIIQVVNLRIFQKTNWSKMGRKSKNKSRQTVKKLRRSNKSFARERRYQPTTWSCTWWITSRRKRASARELQRASRSFSAPRRRIV